MVVAIFGPTAAGKSELALAVAERAGGEIVSADSMQLYRGLPTLTAQPSDAERRRVAHHLVGVWPLAHAGSVAEYGPLARAAVDGIAARGALPVVVGGTGLYLRAALADLRPPPRVDPRLRARCERLYDERGAAAAHARLAELDPAAAAAIHANDRRRVVRALELVEVGASLHAARDTLWTGPPRLPTTVFTLEWERAELHRRIERRVQRMLAGGALDEVREVRASGVAPSATAARILGLAECLAVLDGVLTRAQAAERIAARSRQYARRQEVWMRKIPGRIALRGADGTASAGARILETLP